MYPRRVTVLRTFGDSALARVALIGADPRDDEDLRLRKMETWYLVEARDGKISGKIANEQPNRLLDPATAA